MKKNIHPEYKKATISCACGNTIETSTTVGDLRVEICSACHPFFTGKQKLVDTAGRVDKFKARMQHAEALKKESFQKTKKEKAQEPKNLQKTLESETVEIKEIKTAEKVNEEN